jgi:hypothetical protein
MGLDRERLRKRNKRELRIYGLLDRIDFGKFNGTKIIKLIEENPSYVRWCTENIDWFDLHPDAEDELAQSELVGYEEDDYDYWND